MTDILELLAGRVSQRSGNNSAQTKADLNLIERAINEIAFLRHSVAERREKGSTNKTSKDARQAAQSIKRNLTKNAEAENRVRQLEGELREWKAAYFTLRAINSGDDKAKRQAESFRNCYDDVKVAA